MKRVSTACLALSVILPFLSTHASQIRVEQSLSLKEVVRRSDLIIRANCAFPDRECKSPDGKLYLFKGIRVLKGTLQKRVDTLDVQTWDEDLLQSFRFSQRGSIKKSLSISGYKPQQEWKDAIRKPLVLFLSVVTEGELHFVAPFAYESADMENFILEVLKHPR